MHQALIGCDVPSSEWLYYILLIITGASALLVVYTPPKLPVRLKPRVHAFGVRAFEVLAASEDILSLTAHCLEDWEACELPVEEAPDLSASTMTLLRAYLGDIECGIRAVCGCGCVSFSEIRSWPAGDAAQEARCC